MNRENKAAEATGSKRSRKTGAGEYNEIDWHGFPEQAGSITVLYSRVPAIAAAIVYIFFGGITLMLLFSNRLTTPLFFLAVTNALILAAIVYLRVRAKRRSVKSFDAVGALSCNGQQFLWNDFRGRVLRTGSNRYGGKHIWRTELIFTGNRRLWILPQRIKNFNEIRLFLETLPPATLKELLNQPE